MLPFVSLIAVLATALPSRAFTQLHRAGSPRRLWSKQQTRPAGSGYFTPPLAECTTELLAINNGESNDTATKKGKKGRLTPGPLQWSAVTTVVASYGAIEEIELGPGEQFTVDTGHLVTFTEGMGFNVRKIAGWKSTIFGGEGLVVDLTGPGKATLQTRSEDAFLSWLLPKLPSQNASR